MKSWLLKMQNAFGILTKHKEEEVGLFIPQRQIAWLSSILLLFGFLCFMLGYFWGHRKALQRFVAKIEEESFADRINYALYTMNDRDISEFEQEDSDETQAAEDTNGSEEQEELVEKVTPQEATQETEENSATVTVTQNDVLFFAPLAGFGTLTGATECNDRVKLIDPTAVIKKRTSKTAKGRNVTWYQVVTGEYAQKEDLQKIISKIQEKEHIKKVEIVELRKGF